MNIFLIIFLVWWAIGISSAVWDWTSDSDVTLEYVLPLLVIGLIGPIMLAVIVYDRSRKGKGPLVVIKKRNRK